MNKIRQKTKIEIEEDRKREIKKEKKKKTRRKDGILEKRRKQMKI